MKNNIKGKTKMNPTSTRRQFIKKIGHFTLAGTFLPGLITSCISHKKPNIILILADDLGYGDIGCYGQTKIKTPYLDRMANEGMKFTQFYAGSTVCAPSRCSLMTGLHTGHCEIRGNKEHKPEGQHPLSAEVVTLAELLNKAGYTTGAMGKWGLGGPGTEGVPEKQGFDLFFGYNCQREAHFYYPEHLWKNEEKIIIEENKNGKKGMYSQDLIIGEALEFIKNHSREPFFLYLPFTIPHAELAVPEKDLKEYSDRFPETPYPGAHYGPQEKPHAAFAAMVSRLDRDCGKIFDLLKKLNIDNNTIVLFSSDNGPHKEGGHDPAFFESSGPFRGIKRDLYEGGIRVPFIARWPGRIQAGSINKHIGAFWDFLPTVCELAGIQSPNNIDGISFLPALNGKKQTKHEYLYWEFHEQGGKQAVFMEQWKGVRLNVFNDPDGPIELYDLSQDQKELTDVSKLHPEIVKKTDQIMKRARTESLTFPFLPE